MGFWDDNWLIGIVAVGALVTGVVLAKTFLPRTSYNNAERWQLIRDEQGNLVNIEVHRDATES